MFEFRTQFDGDTSKYVSVPGEPTYTEYEGYYDEHGDVQLREVGTHDLYAEIQSHKDSVDINVILSRYASGDVDALNRKQGVYGDFFSMPKTYAELLNRVNEARSTFDALPLEIKEKFGNSAERWLSMFGKEEWYAMMGAAAPDPEPDPAPDPKGGAD